MTVVCASGDSSATAAALSHNGIHADLILGGQNNFIQLGSSNVAYSGDVFSFDATVKNLIGQKLGTTDGTTLDPTGVRVFFEDLPTATSGTGSIDFVNPAGGGSLVDGYATFTHSNQPYYQYNQILATNQTSAAASWRIHIPATVNTFTFSVYVSAPVQYPTGYVTVSPATATLKTGGTRALAGTVHDAEGRVQTGETVTWGTSNASVATVDGSTGVVTGAGDGSATITATSTTRTGTAVITVSNAAGATTTIVGAPASLTVGSASTITVQAKNAAGTNMTVGGDAVVLSASAGSLGGVTDNNDGTYTATLTSTSATTISITGTINAMTIGHPGSVTYTAGAAANITKSAGDAQTATAGTAVATAPAVTITDTNGNPVAGVSVTFAIVTGGTGSAVTGTPATTNASGIATVGSWTLGNAAGANSLSATAGALSVTFNATGVAGAPASIVKTAGDGQSAGAGTAVAVAPAVRVTDSHGNNVSGVSVTFTPSGGGTGAAVTGSPATTDASGIATVGSWTLGQTAGANSLVAAAGALNTTFTATGTAGAGSSIAINAGDAQTAASGAAVATAPSVIVKDQFNNPVAGASVTFSVTGGGGSATGLTTTTNGSGVATVGSWTLGSGGAGCSAAAIASCSRNTLRAVVGGGSTPAVDIKGYIPPIVPATATYQAVGNAQLSIGSGTGLLLNAFSINGNGANGTGATLSITTTSPTGSQSGTAAITGSTGAFTYLSSPTYVSSGVATENFTYTVTDGVAASNTSATLAVNVPERVFYVQPGYTGASTGSAAQPYKDFSATSGTGVQAVAAASDTILVLTGTGTAVGGTLKNTQMVYGQGASVAKTFATGSAGTYRNGGSSITLLATGTAPSIGAMTLGSGNAIRGVALAGTLTGSSFGTLTASETSISSGATQALSLTTGTLSGSFTSISSTGGTNNILLSGVTASGTAALGSGALSGATSDAFKVSGGGGTFTYSGTIANTATLAVNIASMAASSAVTLSGNINTTASAGKGISVASMGASSTVTFSGAQIGISTGTTTGVSLSSNSGTISFTPSTAMQIATTTGTGFSASGGGTVNVTGSGNTINATSTGTALSINGTTIGASGMTFQNISAAGGGANGIFLNSTGSTAGLTVTGNGGACNRAATTCNGGTIGGTSGSDGASAGSGIYLNNTSAVSLTNMRINGTHQNFGIYGTAVSGLTLSKVLLDGTYGTTADTTIAEGAVGLDDLSGSASVSGSYFAGGSLHNFRVRNTAGGTLNRLTMTSDTLGYTNTAAASGNGLYVRSDRGTTNVTVTSSVFLGGYSRGAGFTLFGGSADLAFTNNTMTNTQSNSAGLPTPSYMNLAIVADSTAFLPGTLTYAIANNSINNSVQQAVNFSKRRGRWTIAGSITGNSIGTAGVANSGSLYGAGIFLEFRSLGSHQVLIDQNTIRQYNSFGIDVTYNGTADAGAARSGLVSATVRRNVLANPGSNVNNQGYVDGIHFDPGAGSDTYTTCLNFGNGSGNANTISAAYDAVGSAYSFGPTTSTSAGWVKVVGLATGPFTGNAAATALGSLWGPANGISGGVDGSPGNGYIDFSAGSVKATSSTNNIGLTCNLVP
jgi:hypothetical protein